MSVTTTVLRNPIGAAIVADLDADETPELDIRSGAATLFRVRIDNSANTAATYVKFYDQTTVTLGTSVPFMILCAKAGKILKVAVGVGEGVAFGTAISVAATTAGGTGGTTGPASAVPVRLHTS